MPEDYNAFSNEYTTTNDNLYGTVATSYDNTGTVANSQTIEANKVDPIDEVLKYGLAKPRRVVLKGRIAYDKNTKI